MAVQRREGGMTLFMIAMAASVCLACVSVLLSHLIYPATQGG